MANSSTKIARFIAANNLTSGVMRHKQLGINYLIASLPTTEIEFVYMIAADAINTGKPVCTIYQKTDYFRKILQLLELNGVLAVRTDQKKTHILVTSMPEVIIYDASQK
jgi:hypothetical protein